MNNCTRTSSGSRHLKYVRYSTADMLSGSDTMQVKAMAMVKRNAELITELSIEGSDSYA